MRQGDPEGLLDGLEFNEGRGVPGVGPGRRLAHPLERATNNRLILQDCQILQSHLTMCDRAKMYPLCLLIILAACSDVARAEVPLLDEDIGQGIFHQNKLYMLYVAEQTDPKVQAIFSEFCRDEDRLCAILSGEVEKFHDFKAFIGETRDQYFAIVDVQRRKKYVLPVIEGLGADDIRIFQSKFEQGKLTPFYSSEQPDENTYYKCRKVVSRDLDDFLNGESQVKVLFLQTSQKVCEVCGEMLRGFADLAQRLYDKQIVSFGYYDIFKNDHPAITDQILPYFLVFSRGSEQPYGLPGDKFHELEETIIQVALSSSDIDLDEFRRHHAINKNNEQIQEQFELNYPLKDQPDTDTQQL